MSNIFIYSKVKHICSLCIHNALFTTIFHKSKFLTSNIQHPSYSACPVSTPTLWVRSGHVLARRDDGIYLCILVYRVPFEFLSNNACFRASPYPFFLALPVLSSVASATKGGLRKRTKDAVWRLKSYEGNAFWLKE